MLFSQRTLLLFTPLLSGVLANLSGHVHLKMWKHLRLTIFPNELGIFFPKVKFPASPPCISTLTSCSPHPCPVSKQVLLNSPFKCLQLCPFLFLLPTPYVRALALPTQVTVNRFFFSPLFGLPRDNGNDS